MRKRAIFAVGKLIETCFCADEMFATTARDDEKFSLPLVAHHILYETSLDVSCSNCTVNELDFMYKDEQKNKVTMERKAHMQNKYQTLRFFPFIVVSVSILYE